MLVADVWLEYGGVGDPHVGEPSEFVEQHAFVRYGQQYKAVRSLMPATHGIQMGERELEGSVCCLGRLQAHGQIVPGEDVQLPPGIKVSLRVEHVLHRTGPLATSQVFEHCKIP